MRHAASILLYTTQSERSHKRRKIALPQTGIAWDSLASFFEGNLGAQLLLLDVANSAYAGKDKDLIVQGDREPNVGVVRITRMNGGERDIGVRGMEAEWPKAAFLRRAVRRDSYGRREGRRRRGRPRGQC